MSPSEIRRGALRKIFIGIVVGGIWVAIVLWLITHGYEIFGPGMGVPLVPLMIFITELITGIPFGELAGRWDSLKGWQRGVLGTAIVIIAGTVLAVIGAIIAISLAD